MLQREAQTLIGFLTAQSTGQLTDYEIFFNLRRDLEEKSMVEEEYRLALSDVVQRAKSEAEGKDRGAKAHALAHRETGDLGYLRRAWRLRLIQTPEVELYVLRNLSPAEVATIFDFVERERDLGATADRTWFWASPVVSSRPTIETAFASAAKYTYRIKVELAVQVDYERYFYGIKWLAPADANKTWSKTYRSTATVRVEPLPSISDTLTFQFPRFEIYRESGSAAYSFRTESQIHNPTHRIVAIDLAE